MFVGHKSEDGRLQPLLNHLENTAALTERFADEFGAGDYAYWLGLIHDIGKYSRAFQKRILENGPKVDHSTAGAKMLFRQKMMPAAICAAGHHAGLPDFGAPGDPPEATTFSGRVKREVLDYSAFQNEVALIPKMDPYLPDTFDLAFFIRMLFSSLVDADFLDTQQFMSNGLTERGGYDDIPTLLKALERYMQRWRNPSNELNAKRCEILKNCMEAAKGDKGLYSLTVPTGGGKTVSSLAFALRHAKVHGLRRVIYVIPYTNIIEQTADQFRSIVGDDNVLEHHSSVSFEQYDDDRLTARQERHRLAAENWDAPIVVTTTVQFFESLYANKPSKCRKLHNIAQSVVIFDEAQMLPVPFLKPCVRAVANLVEGYGVTAVLCTATQPSLQKLFPDDLKMQEICPDTDSLFQFFKRNNIRHMGACSAAELAEKMMGYNQALAVVGTRKQAAELYEALPKDGRFHLSTLMHPAHRRRVLKEIRERLKNGFPCRVAATSLVEAGVDVDFPVVFRSEAGLDSIIQAAGRCNREGGRPLQDSVVYVYRPEGKVPPLMEQNISILHEVMRDYEDISSPEAIKAYFDSLHQLKGERLDAKQIIKAFEEGRNGCLLPFAQVAADFKLIDTQTKSILIPKEEDAASIAEAFRQGRFTRSLFRKAGQYMVNVYPQHFQALQEAGDIELISDEVAVLINEALYEEGTGLSLQADAGKALFA